MWSIIIRTLLRVFRPLLKWFLPWSQRFLFGSAVKKVSKGALNSSPLNFSQPNLLLVGLSVVGLNGLHFLMILLYTDEKVVPLISAVVVTGVTAFFLLRGILCPHTRRERVVLLVVLGVFFGIFLLCFLVLNLAWLAFVSNLVLEVVLCFAVMLAELHRLNKIQTKAANSLMRRLGVKPESRIGKLLFKFGEVADSGLHAFDDEDEYADLGALENESLSTDINSVIEKEIEL